MLQSRTPSTAPGHGAPPTAVRRPPLSTPCWRCWPPWPWCSPPRSPPPHRLGRRSPDKLPITVTNDTGRSGLHLYVLGVDLTTGKLGYVNADGAFTPWSLPGGPVPVDAPDASIPGPADGASVTVDVPRNISGRVYFSFGSKLNFGLVDAGLVQPAPWNPSDDNADILFDWSEFTFNDYGLWLNSTQVDQFAVPHTVSVTGDDGSTSTTGALVDGGRQKIIDAVEQTEGFEKTVVRGDDGEVLRVLSPGKATGVDAMSATYLDDYIDEAWSAYADEKLTVVPFAHEPETKFFGTTTGTNLVFTNTAGEQVATLRQAHHGQRVGLRRSAGRAERPRRGSDLPDPVRRPAPRHPGGVQPGAGDRRRGVLPAGPDQPLLRDRAREHEGRQGVRLRLRRRHRPGVAGAQRRAGEGLDHAGLARVMPAPGTSGVRRLTHGWRERSGVPGS